MQFIRGLHNLKPQPNGCALTIGNFDGVHLGHQQIISTLVKKAAEIGLPASLMSFEPLPQEYFSDAAAPRLSRLREKCSALQTSEIDQFLCINFNQYLASLSADEFIKQILVERLQVKYLLIGDDFRFGNKRCGDFNLLQKAGKKYGFIVEDSSSHCHLGDRISSTRIRQALANNQFELANQLLGRTYTIGGRVAHGAERGRTIGFPTANIRLHRHASPLNGVYAVRLHDAQQQSYNGVANIGKRPTVDGQHLQLEVHLFDFEQNIYGQHVHVEFKHKIREEQRFDSFEALHQQIIQDSEQAKTFFAYEQDEKTP